MTCIQTLPRTATLLRRMIFRSKSFLSSGIVAAFTALVALTLALPAAAQVDPIFQANQCFAVADEPQDSLIIVNLPAAKNPVPEVINVGAIPGVTHTEAIALVPASNGGNPTIYASNADTFGELIITTAANGISSVRFRPIGKFTDSDVSFGKADGSVGPQKLSDVDGLTYDINRNLMYGVHRRTGTSDLMFIIDINTGHAVADQFTVQGELHDYVTVDVVRGLNDVDDIAIHPVTRKMYAVINRRGAGGRLAELNPETGEILNSFEILDPNANTVDDLEGLAFSSEVEPKLYGTTGEHGPDGSDSNQLFRIDLIAADENAGTVPAFSVAEFDPSADDVEGLGCLGGIPEPLPPRIDVEKSTNGVDADLPGSGPQLVMSCPVEWTYTVRNTGEIPLFDILLQDDKLGAVQCPQDSLAIGESMSCSALSGVATAGAYSNVATVTASSDGGSVTDTDPSHYTGIRAGIQIEKSTNGVDADAAPGPILVQGDPVSWVYEITNTGETALTNIEVTDDQIAADEISCSGDSTLAPGESMTCTASGLVQLDQYRNVATVTADALDAPAGICPVVDTDPSHYFGIRPGMAVEKRTNGVDADVPEEGPKLAASCPVLWTYEISNTGNIDLENIVLNDNMLGTITCPTNALSVGASTTCSAFGTAIRGAYANEATVTASVVGSEMQLTASDPSHYSGQLASVVIQKSTNGEDADAAPGPSIGVGVPVNWSYLVTNTGEVALTSLVVTDDQLAAGSIDCGGVETLAPGEMVLCTAEGTAIAGQYSNLATVTAIAADTSDPLCPIVGSDPSHYVGLEPDLEPAQSAVVGWSYQVTNTGEIALVDVTVDGGPEVVVICPSDALGSGESMSCVAEGPEARFGNVATVTAVEPGSNSVLQTTVSSVPIDGLLMNVSLANSDTEQDPLLPTGGELVWVYTVTNGGSFPVERISAETVDLSSGDRQSLSCPQTELAAGESMSCQATGTVLAGRHGVIGTVTGYPVDTEQPIYADAAAFYTGVEPAAVGGRLFIDKLNLLQQANGLQDPGEASLPAPNVEIDLYRAGGAEPLQTTGVDNGGRYQFTGLVPGDYYLIVRRPLVVGNAFQGFVWTAANQGNDRLDSDANPEWLGDADAARTHFFRLTSGEEDASWDIGFEQLIFEGTVFLDANGNGTREEDEPGVGGVVITLLDTSPGGQSTILTSTDSQGTYAFGPVDPGIYEVSAALDGFDVSLIGLSGNTADFAVSPTIDPAIYFPVFNSQAVSGGK